jgi:hypothetical protein
MSENGRLAEALGKIAFNNCLARSYKAAIKMARVQFPHSAYLRDCFVMGWNRAQWATEFPSMEKETQT